MEAIAPRLDALSQRRHRHTKKNRLMAASSAIMARQATIDDADFLHPILCQVGLPRKETADREFMRECGATWLSVQAGYLDMGAGPVPQPLPYGPMPRLVLAWISTYAVRHKQREIPIGHSVSEFLGLIGKDKQGQRYANLRVQMPALAACRLQFGYLGRTYNGQPVEQFDAWTSEAVGRRSKWPGVLVLSEGYYRELRDKAVPLDSIALTALGGSALDLDLYAWLAHRLYRIGNRPLLLHWKSLRDQFAQEWKGKNKAKDFSTAFKIALENVLLVYPKARVKLVRGGLLLESSPPPIVP
ncbi:replication protein [Xanthomonas citri pv. aurantifolii]|nr:replication protein [Xanthomonas citri pv. aurantifolii]ARE57079.1 replication protein [Xanthomonas citri pv. aurantifolii]EFF45350.1 plasmid encoded RepA protein [Xanthomonas citri pv. aurantifolii str. ICPB 11122]